MAVCEPSQHVSSVQCPSQRLILMSDAVQSATRSLHGAKELRDVRSVQLCRYKNDPTIFAWNLINEPRCQK